MNTATAEILPFAEPPLDDGDCGDRLPGFILRLWVRLADEDAEAQNTVRRVVTDVLRDMAAEEGTEE